MSRLREQKKSKGNSPEFAELLRRVEEVYASARTYSDRGRATLGWKPEEEPTVFSTHFIRPDRYRLEIGDRQILWKGDLACLYHDGRKRTMGLDRAMMDAALSTCGVAASVAELLLFRNRMAWLDGGSLDGPDRVDGRECLRIGAKDQYSLRTVWLDVKTLLMRKFVIRSSDYFRKQVREAKELEAHLRAIPTIPPEMIHRCKPRAEPKPESWETVVLLDPTIDREIDPSLFELVPGN